MRKDVDVNNSRLMQGILAYISEYPNSTAKEIAEGIGANRVGTVECYLTQLCREQRTHVSGWNVGTHPSGNASISCRYSLGVGATPPRPEGKELISVRQIVVRKSNMKYVIPRDFHLCALLGV